MRIRRYNTMKPGKGPAIISAIVGFFFVCIGVTWTVIAFKMNSEFPLFAVFGIFWTCIAIAMSVYAVVSSIKMSKIVQHRMEEIQLDIPENEEEKPKEEEKSDEGSYRESTRMNNFESYDRFEPRENKNKFCPYCGAKIDGDYLFCNSCGKKLP